MMPGVRVEANRDKPVWNVTDMAGTLNVPTQPASYAHGKPWSSEVREQDGVFLQRNREYKKGLCATKRRQSPS